MKKIIFMFVAMIFIVYQSNAQEEGMRERILFGLKAGTNYSNVYDTQGEEFDASGKFGLVAGAFLAIPIGKYIGVQPEILIAQKGFKAKGNLFGSSYDLTRTTTYIDVPLLFAVKPVGFLTLLAGPQYSYLMKQKYEFENASSSIEQEEEFINDNIRKNTLAFLAGVDINLEHIVVGARVGWDISNNNGEGSNTTPRYKNTWIQTTVGYRFFY
ncbi:porin family protein [Catalinimonas sp. 4WD22]|uniref:porin family protein n=1 Tax=Catalinimonas locisalis TaxID=3133978 RepID=UPI0031012A93